MKSTKNDKIGERVELDACSFYPPCDSRTYESNIEPIDGEGYFEYADWFWDMYEDDLFDCNN